MSDNEHGGATMPDHGLAYPTDRLRGHGPNAREWTVCRGDHPGSHYVSGEAWADNHCAPWIVTRGLTLAEALAHMRVLNAACGGGPGAGGWGAGAGASAERGARVSDYPNVFAFRTGPPAGCPNPVRAALYGRRCRIVCKGRMNSVLLEFEDGARVVASLNAVRKAKP